MKKIVEIISLKVLLVICLCSCSLGYNDIGDDHEYCDKLMSSLCTMLIEENTAGVEAWFAPILEEETSSFHEDVQALIEYFDGEITSIGGRVSASDYSNHYVLKDYIMEYTVETSIDTYRFMVHYIVKDSRNTKAEGAQSFYVLKLSFDEYPNERYVGNPNKLEMGVYVGYPHSPITE